MAYWGEALSYAPDINVPAVDDEASKLALAALAKAKALAKPGLETDLVDAESARYQSPAPTSRSALDQAYSKKMQALYAKYPKDADIASLYAESILILSPWNQWTPDGKPTAGTMDAVDVLKHALKLDPKHLMANHLWIHTVEAGPHPEDGLPSANLLCTIAPNLGHLVHMPSHIYVRTGNWQQAIRQNQLAVETDRDFTARRGLLPTYLPYMGHNRMMLAFAGTMNGSYKAASLAFSDWNQLLPEEVVKPMAPFLDWIVGMPLDVEKRFGHWDKVLSAPEPPEYLPITRSGWHSDRAVALAATHKFDEAQKEYDAFLAQRSKVSSGAVFGNNTANAVLDVHQHLALGEILIQRGKASEGLQELEKAVASEDQLRYDEPPDWIQPCRHTLGAALLSAGKPQEAIVVYKADLAKTRDNGWSTLGISKAYEVMGDKKAAAKWMAKFKKIWSPEAERATSSCLCLPGK